ncbi:MAG: hypothetical protein U5K76_13780 [Woeseiaceae bacterium]|nr:hypothetical protein [Woeseiaceae bacterium]
MRHVEKEVMLSSWTTTGRSTWRRWITCRRLHLRGYAQKNPKQEYKREAFEMFGAMLEQIERDSISILSRVRVQSEEDVQRMEAERRAGAGDGIPARRASALGKDAPPAGGAAAPGADPPRPNTTPFVAANARWAETEPCPCGWGREIATVPRSPGLNDRALRPRRIRVVAGILQDSHGRILRQRAAGRFPFAGLWKFRAARSHRVSHRQSALHRELVEEIGVHALASSHFMHLRHDYEDRRVAIELLTLRTLEGHAIDQEGQGLGWWLPGELPPVPCCRPMNRCCARWRPVGPRRGLREFAGPDCSWTIDCGGRQRRAPEGCSGTRQVRPCTLRARHPCLARP